MVDLFKPTDDWTVSTFSTAVGLQRMLVTADDEMERKSKEPSRSIGTIESE